MVRSLTDQSVKISNGKNELTLNLKDKPDQHWDYAYTNTAYSSQGATSRLEIALELEDRIVVTTHRSHEIDLTRASHQATIYTDNVAGLIKRLEDPMKQRDADKTSAVFTEERYRMKQEKKAMIRSQLMKKNNEPSIKERVEQLKSSTISKGQEDRTNPIINAEEVYRTLMQTASPLVKSLLGEPNHQLSTQNIYRYGAKGSLKIDLDSGLWHNFETEESGNLFHLIEKEQSLPGFKEALDYASRFINYIPEYERKAPKPKIEAKNQIKNEGNRKLAQTLFQKSLPIKGTLAEKYLLVHRGIEHYPHADLRYCSSVRTRTANGQQYVPALLAVSRDEQGQIHHVQITKLDKKTGNKDKFCEPVKQTFGSISNYFVNLNHHGKGDTAYFTEGVETGLSILQVHQEAFVFAVLGKANFANINPKDLPKNVVICVDNDGKDTYKYAKNEQTNTIIRAAQRLNDYGLRISIMIPEKEHQDLNDVLVKEGRDELKKQLSQWMSLDKFKEKCALENQEIKLKINDVKENINIFLKQESKLSTINKNEFLKINPGLIHGINERVLNRISLEIKEVKSFHNSQVKSEIEREI
jgi:hypothetical protein